MGGVYRIERKADRFALGAGQGIPAAQKKAGPRLHAAPVLRRRASCVVSDGERYFRCLETSFVISNIDTCFLPPNTAASLASELIMRRFLASCRPFFLM